jgi:hypothetical protein
MKLSRLFALIFFQGISAHAAAHMWKRDLDGEVTRCFKVKNIKVVCEDFRKEGSKTPVEELQIDVVDYMNRRFSYAYGKAIEGFLCQGHLRGINRILKGADQACITGELETEFDTGEVYSPWEGLETRFGKVLR